MSGAVDAAPWVWAAWTWNVVQRNAPGAMRAIAFTVMPVSERLRFISPVATVSSTPPRFHPETAPGTPAQGLNTPLKERR